MPSAGRADTNMEAAPRYERKRLKLRNITTNQPTNHATCSSHNEETNSNQNCAHGPIRATIIQTLVDFSWGSFVVFRLAMGTPKCGATDTFAEGTTA